MALLRRIFGTPKLAPAEKRSLKREQVNDLTVPVALAMLEGGFIGVIADKIYNVPAGVLALLASAAFIGNLSSYLWTRVSSARAKVPVVVGLQVLTMACLILVVAAPVNGAGTIMVVVGVVAARCLTAGTVTIRSVVWSLNYPRSIRARTTGRLHVFTSLVMVATTLVAGPILDANPWTFRWMYVAGILIALIGILSFSRIEVSGELRHRVYERQSTSKSTTKGESAGFFQILKNDKKFARYELYQFLSGVSNMILEAPLIYLVSRQLQASYTVSIAVIMAIPFLMRTVSVPVWARYFDVVHVTKFRTRLGLVWVLSHLVLWFGAMFSSVVVLGVAQAVSGFARGGGTIAWQLGHNDFAPPEKLSAYMSVHVTLTGLRGALSAFLGIALYVGWSNIGWLPDFQGIGGHVFLLGAVIGTWSWLGFVFLYRDLRRLEAFRQRRVVRHGD
ncbi:MAG: MFS transporter [Gammaproteobacteria bacterium]|nr:MFS transporter [Gammaproteobacteria bacterium]MYD80777.1 MFS transporter [Gammaproteobacteria bacterium]